MTSSPGVVNYGSRRFPRGIHTYLQRSGIVPGPILRSGPQRPQDGLRSSPMVARLVQAPPRVSMGGKGQDSVLRRISVWCVSAAIVVVTVQGCASSPGEAAGVAAPSAGSNVGLSDAAFRSAIAAAAAQGSAVHVAGTVLNGAQSVGVDLQLNADGSSMGVVTIGGAPLPMRAVGGVYYVQLTSAYIKYLINQKGANAALYTPMTNKWTTSLAGPQSMAAAYAPMLSYSLFFKTVTGPDDGTPVHAAGTGLVQGHAAAVYTTTLGDRLYIAASGPAYLLRTDKKQAELSGSLVFTWNQKVAVTAPPVSDLVH